MTLTLAAGSAWAAEPMHTYFREGKPVAGKKADASWPGVLAK
jgi:hypothetical protein